MIDIKSKTHTVRYLATRVIPSDFFKIVRYVGYRGDIKSVPWWIKSNIAHSCCTDLTQEPGRWLSLMKSNTRNEIRRAERDGCITEVSRDIEKFIELYNSFAREKGLNDIVTRERLSTYKELLITKVSFLGKVLAMHANVINRHDGDAFLLFSCSVRLDGGIDKQLIGRANRFLHFKDLEYIKSYGCSYYDWSGVCLDPNDPRYPIGKFKLSMGGKVIESPTLKTPLFRLCEVMRNGVVHVKRLITG